MEALDLARMQFAITSIYHFFFVPLSLGLSVLVALMHTAYARTGDDSYKKMTKFWGKLFVINFAMGVVTGIVMEFQFGMNWSEYSRFMGDIFGAPLAIEALMSFFLESVFLGVWIFGWGRLPNWLHAGSMWLVAIGSNISAIWILIANSFMQQPVGYRLSEYTMPGGEVMMRAEMADFFALITNPNVFVQYPHVLASGICTAAFFVLGISAWHLVRKSEDLPIYRRSFQMGAIYGFLGVFLVIVGGHDQAQHMVESQPMKMAAAEALWDTEDPASFSVLTVGDLNEDEIFSIRLPSMLSVLAYNTTDAEVRGINDLQAEYEQLYGPGDYVPPIAITYWSFRIMVGIGFLMLALILITLYLSFEGRIEQSTLFLKALVPAIALPYIASSAGWILAEVGRQPWIVFGLQRTEDALSPNITAETIAFSLVVFTVIYGVLIVADVYLLRKFALAGTEDILGTSDEDETPSATPPLPQAQGAFSGD